ncbi:MAG TPA: Ppx/GppA family phosphatase [Bacteroidales bacterium]|nr:Ppx/GppA family phosphatase [Bacteroidales bacterium]
MPRIFASIDIGSNAVRLLFSNVYATNRQIISEKATLVRIPVRLGLDVFQTGSISDHRMGLLIRTLQAFKLLMDVYQPVAFRACATAAMREADNQKEVLRRIRKRTGMDIEVIDGHEEARLISTCNSSRPVEESPWHLYVDVGGGSTEITLFHGTSIMASESFRIGTIRLLTNHIGKPEWNTMKEWIKFWIPADEPVICFGSGGNINKIVKLFGNQAESSITRKRLSVAYEELLTLPVEERKSRYGMREDRADVIVPAAEIFLRLMKWAGIKEVIAPKFGLADGLAIAQYEAYAKQNGLPLPVEGDRVVQIT